MELAGRAWRGFFAVGEEFTSGKPDIKEGLYLGLDHADDNPHVIKKTPMFGKNLYP
jgi:isopenicillin N synthase-like dioxygenase